MDQVDTWINKVVELGFARRLHNDTNKIEVRRIIKAFVDAQWLHDLMNVCKLMPFMQVSNWQRMNDE